MTKICTRDVTFNETVIHRQTYGRIDKDGSYKISVKTKRLPLVDESFSKSSSKSSPKGQMLFRSCRALSERILSNRPPSKISKAHSSPSWKEIAAIDPMLRVEEFSEDGIKRLYADTFIDAVYPTRGKRLRPHTPKPLWKRVKLSPLQLEELKSALGVRSIHLKASKTYCITYFGDCESQRKDDESLITRIMKKFFASLLNDQ